MAESLVSDQDQYSCPICLDLIRKPVTIPCGHSYCMACIKNYWDMDELKRSNCPQCRQNFIPRPALNKNTMLAEIMEKVENSNGVPPAQDTIDPEDIECDFCTGKKVRAFKSCLECRASYCETHLQPHYDFPALKRHKLVSATNMPTCLKHDKLLEVFCRTDQRCICMLCLMDDHKGHDTASCATEREEKQVKLKTDKSKFEEKCREKENKLVELQNAIDDHVNSAHHAIKDTEKAFNESISFIEKRCTEIIERITAQKKADLDRLGGVREQLELEIATLRGQGDVLDRFLQTGDDIYFLQNFDNIPTPPGDKDYHSKSVKLVNSFENVSKTVSEFNRRVGVFCKQETDNILDTVSDLSINTIPDLEPDFQVKIGDRVCVKSSVKTPKFNWGTHVTHKSIGVVKALHGETLIVNFPGHNNWKGDISEMELASSDIEQGLSTMNGSFSVGDKVRVKLTVVTPKHKWGGVTHKSVGTVTAVKDDDVTVDFPECNSWKGMVSEMEPISSKNTKVCFKVGDQVRVKASVSSPKRGWGRASHKSVGVVTAVNDETITVDFPEHKSWKATIFEMELASTTDSVFNLGDRVRVKASVRTPKQLGFNQS